MRARYAKRFFSIVISIELASRESLAQSYKRFKLYLCKSDERAVTEYQSAGAQLEKSE